MQEKPATTTIYVFLLNEGTDVWRPVDALHITGSIYRISLESVIPDTETWQFFPGDVVRCEEKQLGESKHLVAIEKVKANMPQPHKFLISAICGILYALMTDYWIFEHLRYKPDISFVSYAVQNLLGPSLIFLMVGSAAGYIFLWLLTKIIGTWHIISRLIAIAGAVCAFYFLIIIGGEIYYWVVACRSCGG